MRPSTPSNAVFSLIVAEALGKSTQERRVYLDSVFAENPELRGEVEELLSMDREEMDPVSSLEEGTIIAGYEVIRELGHGAMGVVYLARDPKMDRLVALKRIRGAASVVATTALFSSLGKLK